jgi:hypothetical protein
MRSRASGVVRLETPVFERHGRDALPRVRRGTSKRIVSAWRRGGVRRQAGSLCYFCGGAVSLFWSAAAMYGPRNHITASQAALANSAGSGGLTLDFATSWLLAPGSWLLAPGSWLLAPGSWLLAPGSWLLAPGSWLLGYWLLLLATRLLGYSATRLLTTRLLETLVATRSESVVAARFGDPHRPRRSPPPPIHAGHSFAGPDTCAKNFAVSFRRPTSGA